jgi:hypothetical protein
MGIETHRKGTLQVIRFVSDSIDTSDAFATKEAVEKALMIDVRDFVFSVSASSFSSRAVIFELLMHCKKMIYDNNGQILFMETCIEGQSVYRCMCEMLQIPFYMKGKKRYELKCN